MNVVRRAMSGARSRIFAIMSRYSAGEPGRRIRESTFAVTCCSGMSQYDAKRGSRPISSKSDQSSEPG